MKPHAIKSALKTCVSAKRPCFIWGSPGIGKSNVVAQVAQEMNLQLTDIRAILLDPVDLRGLPTLENGKAKWAIPDFLPTSGKGILFLDELNAAPPLVQAACYQLILDRKLGEYVLPDEWSIVAAGNLESDKAVTHKMSTALKSRFVHLYFEINLDDWVKWAIDNNIYTPIIAFIRFRPNLLHNFNPSSKDNAFPCPRTWEFVSDLLIQGIDNSIEYDLISGTIGEGATVELLSFLRIFRDLPNPDVVLLNPESANIPDNPATLYAICGALSRKANDNNIDRVLRYSQRLPREFDVLLVTDVLKRDSSLASTRSIIEWFARNSDIQI